MGRPPDQASSCTKYPNSEPGQRRSGGRSDLAREIAVNKLGITIGTFDIACLAWDLQPNAGMTQGTLTPVAGDTVVVHDTGFRSFGYHGGVSFCRAFH